MPSILFALFVLVGFLRGLRRGFRKSLILLIQAIAAFVICLGIYLLLINNDTVDGLLLTGINSILGSPSGLQDALGVTGDFATLKQVLAQYISDMLAGIGAGPVTAADSGYVMALVLLAYHIVFALLLSIVYKILQFIFYLVYLIFYSEGRYRRKKKEKEKEGGGPYKKRKLAGAIVGLSRGLVAGLVCVSLIGGVLSVVTGGYGEGKTEDYAFGEPNIDQAYTVYRSLDEYGTKGIIKILNTVRDSEDVPFYLYITDLIFSGRLVDENLGIDENIKFRDELTGYVGFAKNVATLVMKYGGDTMKNIVSSGNDEAMNEAVKLFENEDFNREFRLLIENFDAKTFISGFALSFIDSVVENIDQTSISDGMDENTVNMIKILFKPDYYSDKIPSDAALLAAGKKVPVLKASSLISKKDILAAYDVIVESMNKAPEEEGYIDIIGGKIDTLSTLKIMVPFVSNLSILSTEKASEVDPVLERLYTYVENTVLTDVNAEGYVSPDYYYDEKIEWTSELKTLLGVAGDALNIYATVAKDSPSGESNGEGESNPEDSAKPGKPGIGEASAEGKEVGDGDGEKTSKDALDMIVNIFDAKNENYTANMTRVDRICDSLSKSKLIGRALSSSYMYSQIKTALSSVASSFDMPENVRYDSNGGDDGEIKALLDGLKSICKNETTIKLLSDTPDFSDLEDFKPYAEVLTTADESGNAPIDCVIKSKLLHSLLSAMLVDMSKEEDSSIYISDRAKQSNSAGEKVNIIEKDLLKDILQSSSDIIDLISEISGADSLKISEIVSNDAVKKLTKNIIVQGTAAKLLINALKDNESIVIPASLSDPEKWLDSGMEGSSDFSKGEFRKLFDFIAEANFDIDGIVDGSVDVIDEINKLSDEKMQDNMLASDVLWYTISYLLSTSIGDGGMEIIVPDGAKADISETETDVKVLIKREEIKALINRVILIAPALKQDETDVREMSDKLIELIVVNKNKVFGSLILDATIINFVVNGNVLDGTTIEIPTSLKENAKKENLAKYNFDGGWGGDNGELVKLINALDVFLGVSATVADGKKFTMKEVSLDLTEIIKKLKDDSVLTTVYASEILKYTVSVKIKDTLTGESLMDNPHAHEEGDRAKPYKIEEIRALVSILPDSGEINVSAIAIDKLLTLYVKSGEKVEEKSALLTAIISLNVRKISDITVPETVKGENIKRNETDTVGVDMITVSEIYDLLTAVKALGINSINDISGGSLAYNKIIVKLKVDATLTTVYASEILKYTVSVKIKDTLTGESLMDNPHAHEEGDRAKPYKIEEIRALVSILPDSGEINVSAIAIDKLLTLYVKSGEKVEEKSALLTAIISLNVRKISDITVPETVKGENIKRNETDTVGVDMITVSEIYDLLTAVKALGISSINDISGESLAYNKIIVKLKDNEGNADSEKLDTVYASEILKHTVSGKIRAIIASNANIKDSPRAHEGNDIRNPYKQSEILTLIKFVEDDNTFTVDSITIDKVLTCYGEGREDSALMTAIISAAVLALPQIKVPSFATENIYEYQGATAFVTEIKSDEVYRMLLAVNALGISKTSEINDLGSIQITFTDTVIDAISASDVLRATVSANLKIKFGSTEVPLFVKAEHFVEDAAKMKVLTTVELKKSLIAARKIAGQTIQVNDVSLDLKTISALSDEDLGIALDSDIIRYAVSDKIDELASFSSLAGITLPTKAENADVYQLSKVGDTAVAKQYYDKSQCKLILKALKDKIS